MLRRAMTIGCLLRVGLLSVTVFLLLTGLSPAQAGVGVWSVEAGLGGGTIAALAIDPQVPTTLYAVTKDNVFNSTDVFKSTDGGAHWAAVNTGLTDLEVTTLAIDPQVPTTLYAG